MDFIRAVWRGCCYHPEYGHHPGTPTLVFFLFTGAVAGSAQGLSGALLGIGVMAAFSVPLYLAGAYSRGKDTDHE